MLFAAGVGIGLMFFGVAEPVTHFLQPPLGSSGTDVAAAQRLGIAATIFHWGVHGWAIYAVVALALAFASYNLGLPLTLRSAFYPLLGEAIRGRWGHLIDTLAVVATLFGLATSLGLGAEQTVAGLAHLFGAPASTTTKVLLIAGITGMALASVVMGIEKGVKRLSQANLLLALLLLACVVAAGPTRDILAGAGVSLGWYVATLGPLSNWIGREDLDFMHDWTLFYWAWWFSWSPFVGMFIARVSRGRTVRRLIGCMLIAPLLCCVLWMNAFGGTAVSQYVDHGYREVVAAVQAQHPEIALFRHAGRAAAGQRDLVCGHRAGRDLLRYVLRLRVAGHRYDYGRRQAGRAGRSAGVLVHVGGHRCHLPAARRRPRRVAGRGHHDRFPVLAGLGRDVLQHVVGPACLRCMSVVKHRFGAGRLGIARCLSTDGWGGPVALRHRRRPGRRRRQSGSTHGCAPAKCAR